MADKKGKNDKQQSKAFSDALKALGLAGDFMALIDAAVRNDWDQQTFVTRLTRTDAFRHKFPGLIEPNGTLANALTGEQGAPISVSSLGSAIKNYRTFENQYSDIGQKYGYGPVSRQQMALLLKKDTSPTEFAARLGAMQTVASSKDQLQLLAKQAGLKNISDRSLWELAAGGGDRQIYDALEATRLREAGLGLGKAASSALAKDIGQPGTTNLQSVDQVISYVRQNLQSIGPELASQGINTVKLVKVLANPGAYADEMQTISQVAATRQGLGKPVYGSYLQKAPGGGLAQYPEDQTAQYG